MTDLNTLARQLVEHPRWRWEPGMVTTHHVDPYSSDLVESPGIVSFDDNPVALKRHATAWYGWPDLEHPTTKGWLLHMLREAADLDERTIMIAGPHPAGPTWNVWLGRRIAHPGPTEGAALAAALLAVWNGGAASRRSMSMDDLTRARDTITRCCATLLDASYTDGIPTETTDVWRTIAADAADAEKAIVTRLRAAEARTAWQPIETAPLGQWVLACYAHDGREPVVVRRRPVIRRPRSLDGSIFEDGHRAHRYPLTHWMPLPAQPASEVSRG